MRLLPDTSEQPSSGCSGGVQPLSSHVLVTVNCGADP
jgi:hypothetical protein